MSSQDSLQSIADTLARGYVAHPRGRANWKVLRVLSALYAEEGAVFTFNLTTGKPDPLAVVMKSLAAHLRVDYLSALAMYDVDESSIAEATVDVELDDPERGEESRLMVWVTLSDHDGNRREGHAEVTLVPEPANPFAYAALRTKLAIALRHPAAPAKLR